jgi:predicted RNA-binding Zn-ribbon protein involved in translation (DUF1610 family)
MDGMSSGRPEQVCSACGQSCTQSSLCPKCGDSFCNRCINAKKKKVVCPTCTVSWGQYLQRVQKVQLPSVRPKSVEYAKLACSNWGCKFVGLETELETHAKSCEHALLFCSNNERGCPIKAKRSFLVEHVKTCRFAPMECAECGERLTKAKFEVIFYHSLSNAL